MKYLSGLSLVLLVLVSGCQSVSWLTGTDEEAPKALDMEIQALETEALQERRAAEEQLVLQRMNARRDVLKAQTLLLSRQPELARPLLEALQSQTYYLDDVMVLMEELARQEAKATELNKPKLSDTRAIDEVGERLVLPETYGDTVVISPSLSPLEMPSGPMEEILRRRIKSISLVDAALVDILDVLRETEGLNIISDQSLAEDAALTIHAKDVPIYELLSYVSRNMGIAFHLGENMIWVTATETQETGPKLETRIYQLRKGYIPGGAASGGGFSEDSDDPGTRNSADSGGGGTGKDDLYDALVAFLEDNPDNPADAKFEIYRNRNLLVIRNTRENLRFAEEIIRRFDEVPLQVLIEARFIEIGQTDLLQVGVELGQVDDSGNLDPVVYNGGSRSVRTFDSILGGLQNKQRGNLRMSGVIDNLSYNMLIEALEEKSSSRNLSAPRITVINNQSANLRKGRTIQYFRTFEAGDVTVNQTTGGTTPDTINSNAVVDGEAEELELGIALGVVPSISNDGQDISLSLDASITDLIQFRTENSVQLPETSESQLQTVVTVGSGETVVMGGLVTSTQGESVNKIPILGDLPLIGFLFRKTETSDDPSHLLIFVTATIVDRDGRFNRFLEQ